MNISVSSKFDVGDKVWIKTQLDSYITTETSMRGFLSFYLPLMVFKVESISVEASHEEEDTETSIQYNLICLLDANSQYTATIKTEGKNNILESNLYSFQEGIDLISAKLSDFTAYITSLS